MVDAAPARDTIRAALPGDTAALNVLMDTLGLFPSAMLEDIMADYLGGDPSDGFWATYEGECCTTCAAPGSPA
jgi:hypothetical protein